MPFLAVEYMKENYMPQGYEESTKPSETLDYKEKREAERESRKDARADKYRAQTGQPTVSGNEFDNIFSQYEEEKELFGGIS